MLALTQEEHETFKALNNHHPYIETVVTADEVDEDWYLDTIIVYISSLVAYRCSGSLCSGKSEFTTY